MAKAAPSKIRDSLIDYFTPVLYINHVVSRIPDPIRFDWNEVKKVAHFYLTVNAMKQPMQVLQDWVSYGENNGDKKGN